MDASSEPVEKIDNLAAEPEVQHDEQLRDGPSSAKKQKLDESGTSKSKKFAAKHGMLSRPKFSCIHTISHSKRQATTRTTTLSGDSIKTPMLVMTAWLSSRRNGCRTSGF